MSEKTVSNLIIRLVLDSTEEIIGTNGLKAMLNYAKLINLYENKPDYSFDKNYTDEEYGHLTASWYKVLGTSGGKAVFRMIGKSSGKRSIGTGIFDSLKDLPGNDKLFKMVELFAMATGRGKATREGDVVIYDNPQCSACSNFTSDTSVCTALNGAFDEYAAWAGVSGVATVETECKAKGDKSCRYEIRPAKA
jgi:predicted hydrocarbon binding protein